MTSQRLAGLDGVYVINLQRRPDRLAQFKLSSGLKTGEFHRHHATDVTDIAWSSEMQSVFGDIHVAGLALSHYQVIKHIATTKKQLHLILEDNAVFAEKWIDKWNQMQPLVPKDTCVTCALMACVVLC